MEKTVNKVSTEQKDIKDDISQIQTDIAKDREDINAIYEDTSSIKVREIANASKIKSNSEAVSKIETDIAKFERQQKSNSEKLNNIKTTIRSEVSEMVKEQVVEHIKGLNLDFPPLTVANNTEAPTPETQEKISKFREFVNSQCAERDEIMKRKCQLMIFNLKEAGNADADKKQVDDLLALLELDEKPVIEQLVRMGKQKEGKHKPIRITLDSLSSKRKILANAKKLRCTSR